MQPPTKWPTISYVPHLVYMAKSRKRSYQKTLIVVLFNAAANCIFRHLYEMKLPWCLGASIANFVGTVRGWEWGTRCPQGPVKRLGEPEAGMDPGMTLWRSNHSGIWPGGRGGGVGTTSRLPTHRWWQKILFLSIFFWKKYNLTTRGKGRVRLYPKYRRQRKRRHPLTQNETKSRRKVFFIVGRHYWDSGSNPRRIQITKQPWDRVQRPWGLLGG